MDSPIFTPVPSLAGDNSSRSGSSSKLIHTSVMLLNTMASSTRSTKQMAPRIARTTRVSCFRPILMITPWHSLNFLLWLAYPCLSGIWVELWQCIRDVVNQLYLEWVNSCDCDHVITANLYPWIIKWLGRYEYSPYFIVIYIQLNIRTQYTFSYTFLLVPIGTNQCCFLHYPTHTLNNADFTLTMHVLFDMMKCPYS